MGSVVKHSTADPEIASSIPLTPANIIKRRYYVLFRPWKKAPVCKFFTLDTLMNLVCYVWWALRYFALCVTYIKTNNLYSPTPNGQMSKCVVKKPTPSHVRRVYIYLFCFVVVFVFYGFGPKTVCCHLIYPLLWNLI